MSVTNNANLFYDFIPVVAGSISAESDSKAIFSNNQNNKVDLEEYYTPLEVFGRVADIIRPYADQLNLCIDFSAGNGDFSRTIRKINASVRFEQFDLCPRGEEIQQKDWFSVKPEDYEGQEVSLIGFNPPFGKRGRKAFEFIKHALEFRPKFMIYLLPFNFEYAISGYEGLHFEAVDVRFTVPVGSQTSTCSGLRYLDLSTKLHLYRRLESEPTIEAIALAKIQDLKADLVDMNVKAFCPWDKWRQGIAIRHRGRNSGTEFYFKDKVSGLFFVHVIKKKRPSTGGNVRGPLDQMRSYNTFFKIEMLDSEVSTWVQNFQSVVEFGKKFFDDQNGANRMAITRPAVFRFCKEIRLMNLLPNPEVQLPDVKQELVLEGINLQEKISIYRFH